VCIYIYIYRKRNEKKQSWSKFIYYIYRPGAEDKGNNKTLANNHGILAKI